MSSAPHIDERPSTGGPRRKLLLVAALLLAVWGTWHFWLNPERVFATARFNAQAWLEKPTLSMPSCHRGGMAANVRDEVLHTRMKRADVEALLGKPDRATPQEYEYGLGACSGFRIDIDVLHVYFAEGGTYTSSVIRQH